MLLHSLKLDIHSRSIALGSWPDQLYESNDLTRLLSSKPETLQLNIEYANSRHAISIEPITADTGTFAEVPLTGGMCWFNGERFYSESSAQFSSQTEFVPASGTLNINIGGRYDIVSPDAIVGQIVKQIMHSFVMPFYSLKFLHGAVVTRNGTTIMLTGKGGAGKTTTALHLLASGYTLLSDDGPLFTHHNSNTWALSSLDFSQATDTTLDLIPPLRDLIVGQRDHRGKYKLLTNRIQPDDEWRRPQKVSHIVHLARKECAIPRFAGMGRAEATADMVGEAMTVFRPSRFADNEMFTRHSTFSFDVITSLLHDARILRLEYADRHLSSLPFLFDGIADA